MLVYEEPDKRFSVSVELTRSEKFIVVDAQSKITSAVRAIPADDPTAEPVVIAERRHGVEYSVEHHGHRFMILHNDDAEDFALAYTSADKFRSESVPEAVWRDIAFDAAMRVQEQRVGRPANWPVKIGAGKRFEELQRILPGDVDLGEG